MEMQYTGNLRNPKCFDIDDFLDLATVTVIEMLLLKEDESIASEVVLVVVVVACRVRARSAQAGDVVSCDRWELRGVAMLFLLVYD